MGSMNPAVWIVVLNWNNGRDTVQCLQSILDAADPAVEGVVVCDNASTDDSVSLVRSWSSNRYIRLDEHAWRLGRFQPIVEPHHSIDATVKLPRFVLIHTGANLGFAGGNNVGLCFVQQLGGHGPILVLNNDTLVTADCVSAMASRLADDPRLGMCGCTVVYHHSPSTVQAWGGASFQPWLARASHIGAHAATTAPRETEKVERRLDYILGAALMISRRCLDEIGHMDERYFLYFEEIDWALRARRRSFLMGFAPQAVVFHKEGATIGSSHDVTKRSLLSEYFMVRSSILFTLKCYPYFLPTVLGYALLKTLRCLAAGDQKRAIVRAKAMFGLRHNP